MSILNQPRDYFLPANSQLPSQNTSRIVGQSQPLPQISPALPLQTFPNHLMPGLNQQIEDFDALMLGYKKVKPDVFTPALLSAMSLNPIRPGSALSLHNPLFPNLDLFGSYYDLDRPKLSLDNLFGGTEYSRPESASNSANGVLKPIQNIINLDDDDEEEDQDCVIVEKPTNKHSARKENSPSDPLNNLLNAVPLTTRDISIPIQQPTLGLFPDLNLFRLAQRPLIQDTWAQSLFPGTGWSTLPLINPFLHQQELNPIIDSKPNDDQDVQTIVIDEDECAQEPKPVSKTVDTLQSKEIEVIDLEAFSTKEGSLSACCESVSGTEDFVFVPLKFEKSIVISETSDTMKVVNKRGRPLGRLNSKRKFREQKVDEVKREFRRKTKKETNETEDLIRSIEQDQEIKDIPIGEDYQAELLPFVMNKKVMKKRPVKLVWNPEKVKRKELERYFKELDKVVEDEVTNENLKIKLLRDHNFNVDNALENVKNDVIFYKRFFKFTRKRVQKLI